MINGEDLESVCDFVEGVTEKTAELRAVLHAREFPGRTEALCMIAEDFENLLHNLLRTDKKPVRPS